MCFLSVLYMVKYLKASAWGESRKWKGKNKWKPKMFLTEAIQWKLFTNWKRTGKLINIKIKNVFNYGPDNQYDPSPVFFCYHLTVGRKSVYCCENKLIVVVQLPSHVQLCNPMDYSTPRFPVFHYANYSSILAARIVQ